MRPDTKIYYETACKPAQSLKGYKGYDIRRTAQEAQRVITNTIQQALWEEMIYDHMVVERQPAHLSRISGSLPIHRRRNTHPAISSKYLK